MQNDIAKSDITTNELLSLIPFNIFCKGILPCEQSFLIQHYNEIKIHFNVQGLTDWRDKNAELLRDKILNYGQPDYSQEENINILKVKEEDERNEAIKLRILHLCLAIIQEAQNFFNSLQFHIG